MDRSPEREVPLQEELAAYRELLDRVDPTMGPAVKDLPANDPLRELTVLYLKRWKKLQKWVNDGADKDYASLFAELNELGNWITPDRWFAGPEEVEWLSEGYRAAGLSTEQVETVMDKANRPGRAAPRTRRRMAIEALKMKRARKSYREIADTFCDCGEYHGHVIAGNDYDGYERQLSPCAARYRDLVRQLEGVLKKYS